MRPHSTLKESPEERFLRERGHLREVPLIEPRVLFEREHRKVSNDGYVFWAGNFYPVPMEYCLRDVMVECVFGRSIRICGPKGNLISEQELEIFGNGIRHRHPGHEAINNKYKEHKRRLRSAIAKRFIDTFGSAGQRYLEGLKEKVGANLYWHLDEILSFCDLYALQEVIKAIEEYIEIGSYHKNSILRLLDASSLRQYPLNTSQSSVPYGQDITRPLSSYSFLKEARHE